MKIIKYLFIQSLLMVNLFCSGYLEAGAAITEEATIRVDIDNFTGVFNRNLLGVVAPGSTNWQDKENKYNSPGFHSLVGRLNFPLMRHSQTFPFYKDRTYQNVSDRPTWKELADRIGNSDEYNKWLEDTRYNGKSIADVKLSFGPHEFSLFAERLNTEPTMKVPVFFPGIGNPSTDKMVQFPVSSDTGRDLVKYLNSDDLDDEIVQARHDNGHPEPFHIKYFTLGNEEYFAEHASGGKYPKEVVREAYVNQVKAFAAAMKAVDPSIKIGIEIGSGQGPSYIPTEWNDFVLEKLTEGSEDIIDYVEVHYYSGGFPNLDDNKIFFILNHNYLFERELGRLENLYNQVKSYGDFEILVGEYGTQFYVGPDGMERINSGSFLSAFSTAEHIKYFQKYKFDRAAYFLLGFHLYFSLIGGEDLEEDVFTLRPSYFVLDMFANHFGDEMVSADVDDDGPKVTIEPFAEMPYELTNVPALSVMASRSKDKKTLYLMVLNKHLQNNIEASIDLKNFNIETYTLHTIHGTDILATNEDPNNYDVLYETSDHVKQEDGVFKYTFEKHSITLLKFHSVRADFYVAPDGDDTNSGSFEEPFATWGKLAEVMEAGDLAYIRGGTYTNFKNAETDKKGNYQALFEGLNGTADNMIRIWAYPGEEPVWDFGDVSLQTTSDSYITPIIMGIRNSNYLHFKGLRVTGLKQPVEKTGDSSTVYGWYLWQSSNNIFENCTADHLGGSGFSVHGLYWVDNEDDQTTTPSSNNLFLNCDAYSMATPESQNVADGFDVVHTEKAPNTTFRGCRAWFNSKNGFNLYNSTNKVTFDSCWSFRNGYQEDTETPVGFGNGFSLGKFSSDMKGTHMGTVTNSIAAQNSYIGFSGGTENHTAIWNMYNNFAYDNVVGFSWPFPGVRYVFHNNTAYRNDYELGLNGNYGDWDQSHNTWNAIETWSGDTYYPPTLDISVTVDDFMSLNVSQLARPRKADGSLPDVSFGHLQQDSDLIDAGTDVELPYSGSAPDISPFEYAQ